MKHHKLLIAFAASTIFHLPMSAIAANELVMASWGGIFRETTDQYLAKPFTEQTGIPITLIDVGGGWASKIEAQKAAGQIQWDIVDSIDAGSASYLENAGLLEPFPPELKAKLEAVSLPGTVSDYMIQEGSTGVVIVCRTDVTCPSTAAEFFDDEAFPGARAVVNEPNQVLPFAAMAGGQAGDALFPVDLDLAFAQLDSIKSSVTVWPTSGDQQQQVLASGEVDMAIMWNGRAYDLTQKGTPLTFVWDGALLDAGGLVVIKDAPNKDAAFKYIEFYAENAQAQADWAKVLPYGMANKDVASLLPPEIADALPSSHDVVNIDPTWFAQNQNEISTRWQEFLAGAN